MSIRLAQVSVPQLLCHQSVLSTSAGERGGGPTSTHAAGARHGHGLPTKAALRSMEQSCWGSTSPLHTGRCCLFSPASVKVSSVINYLQTF